MEKQIDKYTCTFRFTCKGKTKYNYTTTNIDHVQRPLIPKFSLMFQYEITIDTFNIKIMKIINFLPTQVTCPAINL